MSANTTYEARRMQSIYFPAHKESITSRTCNITAAVSKITSDYTLHNIQQCVKSGENDQHHGNGGDIVLTH